MHSFRDIHTQRSARRLLKAAYLTFGVFVALFVLFRLIGTFYITFLLDQQHTRFQEAFRDETNRLHVEGDAVAKNPLLIDALSAEDREEVLLIVTRESADREVPRIGVANAEGFIVGRSANASRYGDNVFLSSPGGRAAATGGSAQSVELTGYANQIFLTTSRPIMSGDEQVGALFASRFLDDAYARAMRDEVFPPGVEVVFYSKRFGVYGSSFSATTTRSIVSSYFNSGSTWVQEGMSDVSVDFGNGKVYGIKNIPLIGLDGQTGGVLLFIPRYDLSQTVNILLALITFSFFMGYALRVHTLCPGEERTWRYYVLFVGVSLPVMGLVFFALNAYNIGLLKLERIPYVLYNSTMRLQPEYGIYQLGTEQRITVMIDTGDEGINAASASLRFDPTAVSVKAFDMTQSDCSYVVEQQIDEENGRATFACVLLGPHMGEHSMALVDLIVEPKRPGTFSLTFEQDGTSVLAADGLATNVLRESQSSSYRADEFDLDFSVEHATTSDVRSFIVFSPTHPNEERWYNAPQASFVWRGKSGEVYRYAFDTSPNTIPTNARTLQGTSLSLPLPGNGVFYFHLQLASGGPVAHYRVQADMTPPSISTILASEESVSVGDVVRLSFNAVDSESGVQKNFYIDLGNKLFLPIGADVYVPFMKAGAQTVTVRVYDGAGNFTEGKKTVNVSSR